MEHHSRATKEPQHGELDYGAVDSVTRVGMEAASFNAIALAPEPIVGANIKYTIIRIMLQNPSPGFRSSCHGAMLWICSGT